MRKKLLSLVTSILAILILSCAHKTVSSPNNSSKVASLGVCEFQMLPPKGFKGKLDASDTSYSTHCPADEVWYLNLSDKLINKHAPSLTQIWFEKDNTYHTNSIGLFVDFDHTSQPITVSQEKTKEVGIILHAYSESLGTVIPNLFLFEDRLKGLLAFSNPNAGPFLKRGLNGKGQYIQGNKDKLTSYIYMFEDMSVSNKTPYPLDIFTSEEKGLIILCSRFAARKNEPFDCNVEDASRPTKKVSYKVPFSRLADIEQYQKSVWHFLDDHTVS